MKYVLNPFSGMVSGFHPDGTPTPFTAQIAILKQIVNFAPQDLDSHPPFTFGYYEITYSQVPDCTLIQVKFSLTPNRNFQIILVVKTNVVNSKFTFTVVGGGSQTISAPVIGLQPVPATFTGNATGQYTLNINPEYHLDSTTFSLTEITIEEI